MPCSCSCPCSNDRSLRLFTGDAAIRDREYAARRKTPGIDSLLAIIAGVALLAIAVQL